MCNTSKKVLFFLAFDCIHFVLYVKFVEHLRYNATHVRIPEHI